MIVSTTTADAEKALCQQIRQNKRAAFEGLYDKYAPALYSIILKMIPDPQQATAALEQTFLHIWHCAGEFDAGKERLFTWLYRKTMHVLVYSFCFSAKDATDNSTGH